MASYRKNTDQDDFRRSTFGDYNDAYYGAKEVVSRGRRGSGPRGRSSRGRTSYNVGRVEQFRHKQSKITEFGLAEDLKKKLFPGIKNPQDALDRQEALQTFKAISLCITTRQIGFGTVHIFMCLKQFNNVPVAGNIYQAYRVHLAVLQVKMIVAQRGITAIQDNTGGK